MSNFQAVYYRASDGSEPVREFIAQLDARRRAALSRQIDWLNELSDAVPHLPFPHSSQVAGEFRELRCHMGSEHYRVLYRLGAVARSPSRLPEANREATPR